MRKRQKVRVEKRTLADGTVREYRYGPRATRTPAPRNTVAHLIAAYQQSPEWARLKPKTTESYTRYLHPVFEAYQSVQVKLIGRKHLLAVRDKLARDRGNGAALTFCRAVSALFAWALDREWIDYSPATRLRGRLEEGTLPIWTEEQAAQALAELPEQWRRIVFLALHTGQRRGDLVKLRWSAYRDGRLIVTQEKTGVTLSVPVGTPLAAELAAWRAETRGLTILETKYGKPWIPGYVSRVLPLELQKLGLPKGLNVHGLRKLAATRLADAGCSTHEIAAITGHKTLAMVQHYTTAADQRVLSDAAVIKLAKFQKPQNAS